MMHAIIQEVLRDHSTTNPFNTGAGDQSDIYNDDEADEDLTKTGCINLTFPFFRRCDSSSDSVLTNTSFSSYDPSSSLSVTHSEISEESDARDSQHTTANISQAPSTADTHNNEHVIPFHTRQNSLHQVSPFDTICKEVPSTPSNTQTSLESSLMKMKPTCLICFETLKPRKRFMHKLRFQCDHGNGIHKKCMNQWIQTQLGKGREPACPLCRKKVHFTFMISFPSKKIDSI